MASASARMPRPRRVLGAEVFVDDDDGKAKFHAAILQMERPLAEFCDSIPAVIQRCRCSACQMRCRRQIFGSVTPCWPWYLPPRSLYDVSQIFVAFEEQHLRDAFVRVDLRRQRRRVRELERHIAFPFRLERRDVDDDAAARIGATCRGRWSARCAECGNIRPCARARTSSAE